MSEYMKLSLGAITGATSDEYYEKLAVMRAEFAAQMLAAFVAGRQGVFGEKSLSGTENEARAKWAVEQADALMRELSK